MFKGGPDKLGMIFHHTHHMQSDQGTGYLNGFGLIHTFSPVQDVPPSLQASGWINAVVVKKLSALAPAGTIRQVDLSSTDLNLAAR